MFIKELQLKQAMFIDHLTNNFFHYFNGKLISPHNIPENRKYILFPR